MEWYCSKILVNLFGYPNRYSEFLSKVMSVIITGTTYLQNYFAVKQHLHTHTHTHTECGERYPWHHSLYHMQWQCRCRTVDPVISILKHWYIWNIRRYWKRTAKSLPSHRAHYGTVWRTACIRTDQHVGSSNCSHTAAIKVLIAKSHCSTQCTQGDAEIVGDPMVTHSSASVLRTVKGRCFTPLFKLRKLEYKINFLAQTIVKSGKSLIC
jgi:hypothetical protein